MINNTSTDEAHYSTSHPYQQEGDKYHRIINQSRYVEVWNLLTNQGFELSSNERNAPLGEEPLLFELQKALNTTLAFLFVQGFDMDKKMLITVDDDKIHFRAKSSAKYDDLKFTKHVCDNRNGCVAHTLV
jgi:hypothetical protein